MGRSDNLEVPAWGTWRVGHVVGVQVSGPVLVSHRERSSGITDALVAAGLEVMLTGLPVGDYVLGPHLVVERKG